jgi:hypothetical protein
VATRWLPLNHQWSACLPDEFDGAKLYGRTQAYSYRFDYESPITVWSDGEPLPTPLGACHALGIMFMWGNHRANEHLAAFCGDGAAADGLAELMMDSWASFAATGCPETDGTGYWPLHDPLARDVMVFGEENRAATALRQNPRAAEMAALAVGESAIKCPSPSNALKDTYDLKAVIEHVQMNISALNDRLAH